MLKTAKDYCGFKVNGTEIFHCLCVCRTRACRFKSTVHCNQPKNGKMDENFRLYSFDDTNLMHFASFNYQLIHIFYDRFGGFGLPFANSDVVKKIVVKLSSKNGNFTHIFPYSKTISGFHLILEICWVS